MAPLIAELLPKHEHYVEAYAGSLAVLLAKPRSALETVNDLDHDLVTFWRCVRDHPAELSRLLEDTPHSHVEFDRAKPPYPDDITDLERARRLFVYLTQGHNSTMNSTGWRRQLNVRNASGGGVVTELDRFRARVHQATVRLERVQVECRPAVEVIERYGADPDSLIYADPPYLSETRNTEGGGYRYDMGKPDDHRDMAKALGACVGAVVVSGYRSPLYDELFAGWYTHEWPTETMNGSRGRKPTCEVLWSNRPLGGRQQLALFEGVAT
jgi:DNA adenine methylase